MHHKPEFARKPPTAPLAQASHANQAAPERIHQVPVHAHAHQAVAVKYESRSTR